MKFVSMLAWIWVIISTLVILFKVYCVVGYLNSASYHLDEARGVTRTWPCTSWIVVLVVCLAWIVATWK